MTVARRPILRVNNPETETPKPASPVTFVSSGSRLLNLALGGGWPSGRIVNVVGDRSSGKTLIAVEACANFAALSNISQVRYVEAEAAFDQAYGRQVGMPVGLDPISGVETVEAMYGDLTVFLAKVDPKWPSLYVLDSLDALSDTAEAEREIDTGSYGASKARKMSELFRRVVKHVERSNCTLLIVSQIRDKMNVSFGETKTRSGGRALDFYASQILWLAETERLKRSVLGVERAFGIQVRAQVRKNKLAPAFREADLALIYGYGVNDAMSMVVWLKKHKLDLRDRDKELQAIMRRHDRAALLALEDDLYADVAKRWSEIEAALAPGMRKYPTND